MLDRSLGHSAFFIITILKQAKQKTRLRENYQGWYLIILKRKYKRFFIFSNYIFSLVSLLVSILMNCKGWAADQWQASPRHRVDLSPQNTLLICSWRPSNLKKIWKRKCTQASAQSIYPTYILEICHNRRSCTNFSSCVNFSQKTMRFLA